MGAAGRGGGRRTGEVLSGLTVALGCVLFLGAFAWAAVLYTPYTVPSDSMTPGIDVGDRVLARRTGGDAVRRGDVVVFTDRAWGGQPMIKRVVGVGGDTVACCGAGGRLTVNGVPIAEPYLSGGGPASPEGFRAEVPRGSLFLLGDNRSTSQDSRTHLADAARGAVPRDAVSGRVEGVVWPLDRWGTLARPTGFEALPGGVSGEGPLPLIAWAVPVGALLILGGAALGPISRRRMRRCTRPGSPGCCARCSTGGP
ncbi:signal peptidase I [Streptomyces sp. URMC 123]|uniref:signal peptidase I n=1 Tax=Streptomyces sp. URMC 123 TaxID=3423403 RepID=UPI003F1A3D57